MADFEFAAVFFFEGPAFAAPEEEVYYDGVVDPKPQFDWDFVVSEYIFVECVVRTLGLVNSFFDVFGVIEVWSEVCTEVLEVIAEGEVVVLVDFDVGCVVFGGCLSWCGDVHCFGFGWLIGSSVSTMYCEAESPEVRGDK